MSPREALTGDLRRIGYPVSRELTLRRCVQSGVPPASARRLPQPAQGLPAGASAQEWHWQEGWPDPGGRRQGHDFRLGAARGGRVASANRPWLG